MKRAIFLDRDGTINEDKGYIYKREDLVFIPGAIDALKELQKYYILYIITNQSGINKGYFTEKQFLDFNDYFLKTLKNYDVFIKEIFFCKHIDEDKCICKKPSTYFIKQIEKKEEINLRGSYTVGDHPSDVIMGKNAGTKSIYLLSGHGRKHLSELNVEPDYIATNLFDAAKYILKQT